MKNETFLDYSKTDIFQYQRLVDVREKLEPYEVYEKAITEWVCR
jgi:hypothetical protein